MGYGADQDHACCVEDPAGEHQGTGAVAVAEHSGDGRCQSSEEVIGGKASADHTHVPAEAAVSVVQGRDHDSGRHADGLADYLGYREDRQDDPGPVNSLGGASGCGGWLGGDRHGSGLSQGKVAKPRGRSRFRMSLLFFSRGPFRVNAGGKPSRKRCPTRCRWRCRDRPSGPPEMALSLRLEGFCRSGWAWHPAVRRPVSAVPCQPTRPIPRRRLSGR